jgi:hypothetical protein
MSFNEKAAKQDSDSESVKTVPRVLYHEGGRLVEKKRQVHPFVEGHPTDSYPFKEINGIPSSYKKRCYSTAPEVDEASVHSGGQYRSTSDILFDNLRRFEVPPNIVLGTCTDGSRVRTFCSDVISSKVHCGTTPCYFEVSTSVGACRQTMYIRFQLEEDGIRVYSRTLWSGAPLHHFHWTEINTYQCSSTTSSTTGSEGEEEQVEEGSLEVADKEEPSDIDSTASSTSSVSDFKVSHEGFRPPSIGKVLRSSTTETDSGTVTENGN